MSGGMASIRFGGSSQSVNTGDGFSGRISSDFVGSHRISSDNISVKSYHVTSGGAGLLSTPSLQPSSILSTSSPSVNSMAVSLDDGRKQKKDKKVQFVFVEVIKLNESK